MVAARTQGSTDSARMNLMHWMTVGVLVVAATGAAVSAHAQGRGQWHDGPGAVPGMMLLNGPPEHVGWAVDHMLDGLGATDAQRLQVKQIAQAAAADLQSQRDAGRGLHDQGMQIFAAPAIDAAAAESVRQQLLARHDQASKRMLQAMLDVGRVLTPEQRAKLGERMKQRQVAMQERRQRMQGMHGTHREPGERPKP